jgi:hypothetical protein
VADHFTHFCATFDIGQDNISAAIEIAATMRDDPEMFGLDYFGLTVHEADGALIIDDNGTSDTDAAIRFVCHCAKRFGLTGFWAMEYCNSSTKSRPDAYGGGVIAIKLDDQSIRSMDTRPIFNAWMQGKEESVCNSWSPQ